VLRLTALEREIIRHRLVLPECIAEALDDDAENIGLLCDQLNVLIDGDLEDISSENCHDPFMAREVLAECLEGSTYCGTSISAEGGGEISPQKLRAVIRTAEALASKLSPFIGREIIPATC